MGRRLVASLALQLQHAVAFLHAFEGETVLVTSFTNQNLGALRSDAAGEIGTPFVVARHLAAHHPRRRRSARRVRGLTVILSTVGRHDPGVSMIVGHTVVLAGVSGNEKESEESKFTSPGEVAAKDVDDFVEAIYNQNVEDQEDLDDNETGVILAHGAKTGVKVRAGQRRAEAKVRGGFVVGIKTKVTKNFE